MCLSGRTLIYHVRKELRYRSGFADDRTSAGFMKIKLKQGYAEKPEKNRKKSRYRLIVS